jgi:type IV pilus assembly protein PilB
MKRKRLGEVLRERGHVSAAELNKALQDQQGKLVHLGELLLQRNLVSKNDLASALAEVSQIPYLDCSSAQIHPEILRLIPAPMARRCSALAIREEGAKLLVAMAEPQNLHILDELRFKTGMEILPRLAFRQELNDAIDRSYGLLAAEAPSVVEPEKVTVDSTIQFVSSSSQERNVEAMREMQSELAAKSRTTPAVLVVASMIRAAAEKGASDIHIEPHATETAIRFRVDGTLRDHRRIPRNLQNSVASRIKILSDMDIAERRAPQDGRFLVKIGERKIDLRVSTLPTQYGETVVMRLLEGNAPLQPFSGLGFPLWMAEKLKLMLFYPQGMILVTGPTGSGKSTTLYSSLNVIRRPSVNIITVEDPVEYELTGLNQVQVNTKAGLTFANSLRSILRQDPNVIMIGEIRDKETAEIAIKAAQTGHLVLSTLHTNDSISAVMRLVDLGIPGFQIASSITAVVAQRLIRRLCVCHKTVPATPDMISQLLLAGITDPPAMLNVANGCELCDLTGFKGRIGIYEMLVLDDAIRSCIRENSRGDEIRALARHNGMKLMQEYALEHIREGLTTLEEVQRVVPFAQISSTRCAGCQRELSAGFLLCPYCGKKKSTARKPRKPTRRPLVPQETVN